MPRSTVVRHRPGPGLAIGIVGLVMLVASLTALPWISVGGEDATVGDLRDAYDALDDLGGGDLFGSSDITVPDVSVPEVSVPDVPDDGLGPVVTPPPVAPDTYTPVTGSDIEPWHELYVKALCWVVAVWVALGLVGATAWVPSTKGGRMAFGFVVAGIVGLGINAADDRGRVGPRVVGTIVAVVGLSAHAAAVQGIFDQPAAPDPAIGVWAGVLGLLLVLVGCIVGTRTEEVPAAAW